MTVRIDHIAAGVFIVGGLVVFAASGDLPFGSLAFPGAGFMPMIVAALLVLMGGLLALGARATASWRELDWGDLRHAIMVVAIAAAAVALYTRLGFLITLPLMMFALLALVERKRVVPAALYSVGATLATYWVFHALRAQLPTGPFGF